MDEQAYADLLTLARSAYAAYYALWHHDDSLEQVIANVAAAMGVLGCRATFVVRKDVVRVMIERMSYDTGSKDLRYQEVVS